MNQRYNHGWYMACYRRDLSQIITPVAIGTRRLILIRKDETVRASDADCPHRGAHLGYGGCLDGDAILCPFHRLRIQLGPCRTNDLQVAERPTLAIGGLVFVRISAHFDNGFSEAMRLLDVTHVIIPGYEMHVRAPAALMIENGFDIAHFPSVHGVTVDKFSTRIEPDGSLLLTGKMLVADSLVAHDTAFDCSTTRLSANSPRKEAGLPLTVRAYSPGLSILEVGGAIPYKMIVAATPNEHGESILRISLALSRETFGDKPTQRVVDHLLENSRVGIEADKIIWEQISPCATPKFLREIDAAVLSFKEFCTRFEKGLLE